VEVVRGRTLILPDRPHDNGLRALRCCSWCRRSARRCACRLAAHHHGAPLRVPRACL